MQAEGAGCTSKASNNAEDEVKVRQTPSIYRAGGTGLPEGHGPSRFWKYSKAWSCTVSEKNMNCETPLHCTPMKNPGHIHVT